MLGLPVCSKIKARLEVANVCGFLMQQQLQKKDVRKIAQFPKSEANIFRLGVDVTHTVLNGIMITTLQ